ncbi:probable protein ABIL5 [Punica granatum]|uniref:Uncharacterized protein n=2 Tax=Punica granatum TaxID=22663 RepID=A0A218XYI9_PUNGR|nr:probable protein ABIL5 [Punica granatum]OWM89890.1 hypothetical protein CDL15_Pgr012527 [Punica granatum]PKI60267.1 hypothetical protein CRG98_019322 [Punica granatum]
MVPEEGKGKEREMPQPMPVDGEEEQTQRSGSGSATAAAQQSFDVAETGELIRFDKSLQELRQIRSQLHYAADYCESTFRNSEDKKPIVDNTKEYICRAMVTVVDHLGNVSSNLASRLSEASSFTDAELRINSLKQRILSCEQLGHKFALTKATWSAVHPRHHPRFLMADAEKPNIVTRDSVDRISKIQDQDHKFDTGEGLPLFLYTRNPKPYLAKTWSSAGDTKTVPVRDGISILSKGPNPTFHFQGNQKNGRQRRSFQGSDILALIRRVTQTS